MLLSSHSLYQSITVNPKSRPILEKFFIPDTFRQKKQEYRATIRETDGKKYGQDVVTLPSSNDTGVYFLTAGTYGYTQDTAIQSGADVSKHYTKATGYIAATGTSDGSADYYAVETVTVNPT